MLYRPEVDHFVKTNRIELDIWAATVEMEPSTGSAATIE
jgi:hypothetical protein